MLLFADGRKSIEDFRDLFDGQGREIALKLIREGYLERRAEDSSRQAALTPPFEDSRVSGFEATRPPDVALPSKPARPSADPRVAFPSPETTQAIQAAADPFEGRRSLATTRMFLFDICERLFARRDPKLAELFRESLRQAKDRNSMLAASRLMLNEVEKVAGHERADSLSERIAMLLPDEQASQTAA